MSDDLVRLQEQINDIAAELGCAEKVGHRHSHGRCIFEAIYKLQQIEKWHKDCGQITESYRLAGEAAESSLSQLRQRCEDCIWHECAGLTGGCGCKCHKELGAESLTESCQRSSLGQGEAIGVENAAPRPSIESRIDAVRQQLSRDGDESLREFLAQIDEVMRFADKVLRHFEKARPN